MSLKRMVLISSFTAILVSCGGHEEDIIYSYELRKVLTIDGKKGDWPDNIKAIAITDRKLQQGTHQRILSDNNISCSSAWDENYLYLFFEVRDADLRAVQTTHDHEELYLDDMVEFLIDPGMEATDLWLPDDLIYHINILKTVKDDRGTGEGAKNVAWDGKAQFDFNIKGNINEPENDSGYSLEVGIPWSEINIYPQIDTELGFNFANGDNDGKGRQLFDWMGAWPMRSPSQFGILKLTTAENEK